MKKAVLLLLAIYATVQAFAQTSNLIFYSEDGAKFYVILNGIRQNESPETNVKVTGLTQPYYKAKIIFHPEIVNFSLDKNLNFNPGTETVFVITKNKNLEYILRWQSEVPLAQAAPPAPGQNVMVYTQTAPVGNVTYTEHTTTTVSTGTPNVNVNMNVPGVNMNINIDDPLFMPGGTTTTTYQTTTTTTSSSNNYNQNNNYPPQNNTPAMSPGRKHRKDDCWMGAVNSGEFDGIKKSISSNGFDETRLSQAKSIVQKKCLASFHVKEICKLFGFEDTMLDFAKFAYDWVYDQENYYTVNDVFGFESSKTELNSFINGY